MRDTSYQCYYCKKKFQAFHRYTGRIPEKEYLRPNRKIEMWDLEIGDIHKICHKCWSKLINKIKKIVAKDRKRGPVIGAWQMKKWRKDTEFKSDAATHEGGRGPRQANTDKEIEEEEKIYKQHEDQLIEKWTEEKFVEEYGILKCELCGARFNEFKDNLHKSNTIRIAQKSVVKIKNFCNQCQQEIVDEIRKLIQ